MYNPPLSLTHTHDTAHDMWKKDATNKTKIMELSMHQRKVILLVVYILRIQFTNRQINYSKYNINCYCLQFIVSATLFNYSNCNQCQLRISPIQHDTGTRTIKLCCCFIYAKLWVHVISIIFVENGTITGWHILPSLQK